MSREVMQKVLSSLMNLQPIIANGLLDKRQLAFIDPHLDVACEALIEALAKSTPKPVGEGTNAPSETLRLVADLELNHEHCPKEVIQKAAVELRRLHQSEREGWRYAKELEQDNANLREQNTWLDTELAELEPAAQRQPLTTNEYTAIAQGTASKYSHRSDPTFVAYTFLPDTLEDFVRTIEAAHGIGGSNA